MKSASRLAALAVIALTLVTTACSSPPGPEPGNPAPKIPANAIAYDDLKSADRPFPFTNDCSQFTPDVIASSGLKGPTYEHPGMNGPTGCSIYFDGSPLKGSLSFEAVFPPNPNVKRAFPAAWDGSGRSTGSSEYFRRIILDDRYYATLAIGFAGGQPNCYLAVDTGSANYLEIRQVLPDDQVAQYGELNPSMLPGYEVKRAEIDKFMEGNCPALVSQSTALLRRIDPNGGSLATA